MVAGVELFVTVGVVAGVDLFVVVADGVEFFVVIGVAGVLFVGSAKGEPLSELGVAIELFVIDRLLDVELLTVVGVVTDLLSLSDSDSPDDPVFLPLIAFVNLGGVVMF